MAEGSWLEHHNDPCPEVMELVPEISQTKSSQRIVSPVWKDSQSCQNDSDYINGNRDLSIVSVVSLIFGQIRIQGQVDDYQPRASKSS